MPHPPVTPSPHRFVIKKDHPAVRSTPLTQAHTARPSTQFNSTPRFTFSSNPRPTSSQSLPPPRLTPSTARFATSASRTPKGHDAIELSSDDGLQEAHDSIETEAPDVDLDGHQFADLEDDYKLEERSPKRRRLSTPSQAGVEEQEEGQEDDNEEMLLDDDDNHTAETTSSLPILSSPPASRRQISSAAPRFLLSTPALQPTPRDTLSTTTTPFLKPPRFRPPDPTSTTQTQSDPLPEQFSPHRKGQKYVSGGLAAEVRDWLLNLEGAIPETRGKKGDEEWVVRIVVDEVSGGPREGMTMVRGRQVHTLEGFGDAVEKVHALGVVKVILAGEGAGTGLQKRSPVETGNTVGIKGPVWEVLIQGERWGVGVDWKVLT